MFPSISNAVLSETVTSEFTATETCQIGVPTGAGFTVKKNNVIVTSSPVGLVVDDTLSITTTAPSAEFAANFVDYTYNSTACKFAVVTGVADARPKIYNQYQNLVWSDYLPVKHEASVLNMFSGDDPVSFDMTNMQGGQTGQRLAAMLDPLTNSVYFVDYTGVTRASKILPNRPIYSTSFYNSTSDEFEFYILTNVGKIYRITRSFVMTESTQVFPYAKTIFTDGENLCLSYLNPNDSLLYLVRFTDLNTVTSFTIAGSGTSVVHHGIAFNNSNKWLAVRDSQVQDLKVDAAAATLTTSQAGQMCWHRGKVAVPLSSNYEVKLYQSIDGATVQTVSTLNTDDYLPFQCTSDGDHIYITCYDSKDVLRWDGVSATYDVYTFDKKVTSVAVIDDWIIASHYLEDLVTTYSPNPTASGINFTGRTGNVGALVGSGYQDYITNGGIQSIQLQDNMRAWVDGYPSSTITSGQNLVIASQAVEGKSSMPVVIGNYAYDYIVTGLITTAKSLDIAPDVLPIGSATELTFSLTLPVLLDPTYISITVGEITVNGAPYYGENTVTTGDEVEVTVRIPPGAVDYFTVLNVANSDFALVASNDNVVEVETIFGRPRGDNETESTFVVDTSGIYYLPELRNAQLTIDGVGIVDTFPVNINSGTSVTIRHTTVSDFINDIRSTYLFGPVIYQVKSSTLADGVPDYIDFGILEGAIPDFEYESAILTITGMSPNYPAEIFAKDGVEISINGQPYSDTVSIEQGDSIQLRWTVKNLWTPSLKLFTILNVVQEYEVGSWQIQPPSGAYEEPNQTSRLVNSTWFEFDRQSQLTSFAKTGQLLKAEATELSLSPTGEFESQTHVELTIASTGSFTPNIHTQLVSANVGKTGNQNHIEWANAALGAFEKTLINRVDGSESSFDAKSNYLTHYSSQDWQLGDVATFAESPVSAVDARVVERHATVTYPPQPTSESPNTQHLYLPMPVFNSIDDIIKYDPMPIYTHWEHDTNYDPTIEFGKPNINRYFEPEWSKVAAMIIETAPHPIPAEVEHRHYVPLVPKFTIYTPAVQNNIETEYATEPAIMISKYSSLSAFNKGIKPYYKSITSGHFADTVTVSDQYTQQGGQATEEQAQQLGSYYANGLPIQTYQQPEGTWSYIITRSTDLVCAVHETGLFIKAWLLGGG
jgi:hypothetical protein